MKAYILLWRLGLFCLGFSAGFWIRGAHIKAAIALLIVALLFVLMSFLSKPDRQT
jgi:membrane protein DedA with SNARE-associated domain